MAILALVILFALLLHSKLPGLEEDPLSLVSLPLSNDAHKQLFLSLVLAEDKFLLLLPLKVLLVEALNS